MMSSGFCSGRIISTAVRLWLITSVYIAILSVCFIYYHRNAMVIIDGDSFEGNFSARADSDIADQMKGKERPNRQDGFKKTTRRPNRQDGFNNTTRPPRLFISPFGQLGNNMFQAAAVVALARQTGHIPTLYPTFYPRLRCFPNLHIQVGVASPNRSVVVEAAFAKFSPSLHQEISKNDTAICCFFQSWKYFSGYFKEIKAMFTFAAKTVRMANKTLMKVRDHHPGSQLVGVHVRRMARPDDYRYGADYVIRAMEYFRRRYKKVHFIICGLKDALRWSTRFLTSPDVTFKVAASAPIDMALLSLCDHMIMTVGTYSWWAAFLGKPGRELVYFPQPYMPNSTLGKGFSPEDHFLPEWTPVW